MQLIQIIRKSIELKAQAHDFILNINFIFIKLRDGVF